MRCLVTGGSGFFGHLLVERLLARGDSVRNFDLTPADDEFAGVDFHRGDIRDASAVRRACEGIDAVYHNVAQQPLSKDPELMRSVNLDGTRNLLSAALDCGVRKVIFTSSTAIFGIPSELPIRRSTKPGPCEPYGRTKVASERLCLDFIERGLDVTMIRPRTILGHGRLGIFQMLFEWIREGRNVPVMGSGHNRFQFIHALDLADASILAAHRPGPQVYNIGTDRFGSMREVLEALCRHAGTGSRVKSVPDAPVRWLMAGASRLGLSPLGRLPLHGLRQAQLLRHRRRGERAGLAPHLLQRGGDDRQLRLVSRQPRGGAELEMDRQPAQVGRETGDIAAGDQISLRLAPPVRFPLPALRGERARVRGSHRGRPLHE